MNSMQSSCKVMLFISISYVPYHSSKNRGEKVYVECSFIGQEDYPIRSDELKEMVFSILK